MTILINFLASILENYLILSFPGIMFKEKYSQLKFWMILFLTFLSYVLDTLNYPFLMIIVSVLLVLYCWVNVEGPLYASTFYIMLIFIILCMINMMTLYVEMSFIPQLGTTLYENDVVYPICMILSKLVFLVIYYIFYKNRMIFRDFTVLKNHLYIFSIMEVILFSLMSLFLTMFIQENVRHTTSFIMIVLLISIFIIFFYQYTILIKANKAVMEEQLKRVALEYDKSNYANLKNSYDKNRSIRHDLKNHLSLLHQMLKNEEVNKAIAYLNEIVHSIDNTESIQTERSTLNYILNLKISVMREQDIKFVLSVDHTLDFIQDIELCVLLGNLFDNGIEACRGLSHPSIECSIGKKGEFVYINMKNTYNADNIKKQNGVIVTNKYDQDAHGFGLKNIKEIVERYQGSLYVEEKELFQVYIMFDVMM